MTYTREKGPALSYEVDTLGFFNAQLRDLRGFVTLAHELIQNADDAKASIITFDACDDALNVENDSLFSDCGQVTEASCAFPDGTNCDFHRFRTVASGGKRLQDDTIGAFGIGFISVFQVTDSPEIESGNWAWRVDLEASAHQRIETARVAPARAGTLIRLPWARRQSAVRTRLAVEPVNDAAPDAFVEEIRKGLSRALLFLRHVDTIEIRRNGDAISTMQRTPSSSAGDVAIEERMVSKHPKTTRWHVLAADFQTEAKRLKDASNGRIERKRRSLVQVAFSAQVELAEGRFYASLPTEHTIPIPLFINADFFPTNDRKRILLDVDYQGQWNRTAIASAANLVGRSLGVLCESLPMERFWGLLEGLWQCRQLSLGADSVLRVFWEHSQPAAQSLPIVLSASGDKHRAADIRLLQSIKEEREALQVLTQDLEIPIVTPDLNKHRNLLLALGVPELNVRHVIDAMGTKALLGDPVPASTAPRFAQEPNKRAMLVRQLQRLQKRAQVAGGGDARLMSTCRICHTTSGYLSPCARTRNGSKRERSLFAAARVEFLSDQNDLVVRDLVSAVSLEDALKCLASLDTATLWTEWQKDGAWWTELLDWLDSRRSELQADKLLARRFAAQPIWPSSSGLHPLSDLSMPGAFSDPLKLASLVHTRLAKHRDLLINVLGATALSVVSYAIQHVPKAFAKSEPPESRLLRELVRVLAQNNGPLRESDAAKKALGACAMVECEDGIFRSAPHTYFRTALVTALLADNTHYVDPTAVTVHPAARELFVWLGVAEKPRATHIVGRVMGLSEGPPTTEAKATLSTLLAALGPAWPDYASDPVMAELQDLSWLPGKGSNEWQRPGDLAASFRDYLFETQATFIDLQLPVQQSCAKLFEFLGVLATPTVEQVVSHLLECANGQRKMHPEVYRFLNDAVEQVPVARLREKPCILLADGTWHVPTHLFWNDHGLHPFLHVLDPGWRIYSRFLAAVGVRESPGPDDAIRVLLEIARAGKPSASIARNCWILLNGFLEREEMRPGLLAVLGGEQSVPLPDGSFGRPIALLLDDRPWLSKLFGEELSGHLLARQEGFWLALQTAGLRPLSSVIVEETTDLETSGTDEALRVRVLERVLALARVFSSALDSDAREVIGVLSNIAVVRASSLAVVHRLPMFEPTIAGHREEPDAWFEPECRVLYVRTGAVDPWTAVARQIAIRLAPTTNISQVTPALRDVLAAESPEGAQALLDELGFTPLEVSAAGPRDPYEPAKPPQDEPTSQFVGPSASPVGPSPIAGPEAPADGPGTLSASAGVTPLSGQVLAGNVGTPTSTGSPMSGGTPGPMTAEPSGLVQPSGTSSSTKPSTELKVHARSYVVHGSGKSREDSGDPGWIETANAGIRHARAYEYNNQRKPRSMPHNHPGWDIESKSEDAVEVERFIEVKATRAVWSGYGVGMTDVEYEKARELGPRYWLYIVENALTAPRLYAFQNPAATVSEYRFDDGWRQFANESDANRPRSILDLPRERT